MKYLTLILLICVSSFSLNKIVIPQRASSGAVITASKTNENLDTIASKVNKLIDSLDQKFPRFTDYSSGDSILRSKRTDFDTTVSDTMYNSGGLYSERVSTPSAGITRANIDTSHSRHATADSQTVPIELGNKTFRGNITGQDMLVDSSDHRIITADSATIPVEKGVKTFRDSSYFAGGLRGLRLYMQTASFDTSHTRHATADSATIPVEKGVKTFRDSSYFASGIKAPRGYFELANIDSIYGDLKFGGNLNINGNVVGIGSSIFLVPNTSDGSDSKVVGIFGGGSGFSTRGAFISVYGNEYSSASASGDVNITAGDSGFVKITGKTGIGGTPDSTLTVGGSAHITGNARIDGGLRLGSGDLLSVYDTGSFPCTLTTDYVTVQKTGTIKYVNIGNAITLSITGALNGTSNSVNFALNIGGMPASIMPDSVTSGTTGPLSDASAAYGFGSYYYIVPADKKIYFTKADGTAWTNSGSKGINGLSKRTTLHYAKY